MENKDFHEIYVTVIKYLSRLDRNYTKTKRFKIQSNKGVKSMSEEKSFPNKIEVITS